MSEGKLSDVAIRNAKPSEKARKLFDGGGLYLEIHPRGSKYWRLKYRIAGVEKRLGLGVYPEVGLKAARSKCKEARRLIAEGQDPSEVRQEAKAQAAQAREAGRREEAGLPAVGTFEAVAREWLSTVHEIKVSAGHAARTRIRLEQDAFPWIGRRPIDEIEAPELLQTIRRVEARGAIETAHRVKDACGQVFRFGIAIGRCKRNPAADLKDALQPVRTRHLAAIVDPAQVGKLLRDMHEYQGNLLTRGALGLSALLLLRPGELRHMEWDWVDIPARTLIVPASVMKRTKAEKENGPPHIVPLADQATAILVELQAMTGSGRFVFPALTSNQRCMSDNTVRSALRRLGYGNDDMTAHGFRAMARTMIAERLHIPPEVIEAQLAHAVPDALGRAYNRTQYLDQRRSMMQAWADYLDRLRKGPDAARTRSDSAEAGR